MSEFRLMLARVGERVTPAEDAFDRLARRRARKQRNRRIATAIFAFAIAVPGSLMAFEAFRGSQGRVAGGGTEPFYALWPEVTLAEAQQAQDYVDGGEPAVQWRTDARAMAQRFAELALGWGKDVGVSPDDPSALAGAGPVTMKVATPPPPCPTPPGGTSCLARAAVVIMQRLVRPDATGIWSVVEIYEAAGTFRLPLEPGETVVSGQEISLPVAIPEGLEVQAGYTYVGECSENTTFSNVHVEDGTARFVVADSTFEETCGESFGSTGGSTGKGGLDRPLDGYVFAMMVNAGSGGSYAPFAAGGPTPYVDTPIAIAAVPVRFVPASPDVAEVACDGTTTQVLTPEVGAQPDGVHVRVINTSSTDLAIDFGDVGGDNAPIGTHEVVWSFFPGQVRVGCWDPTVEREPSLDASFTVVDPNGYFVPSLLDCGGAEAVGGFVDYVEGALGWKGSSVDVVREHATGLLPSDDVSYAGYPKQEQPQVRVVRDGAVVAVFDFFDDGQGGWLMSSYQACSALGIGGIEAAPSPEYPRGWFEWCPDLDGVLPPGPFEAYEAAAVAEEFARAYLRGDLATVADLEDPSVPEGEIPGVTVATEAFSVLGVSEDPGGIVEFGCGPQVAASTVTVVMDDGTNSASADFYLFLIRREDGWKVWGSY